MFQIVIVPVGPSSNFSSAEILLYLQAAVRERESNVLMHVLYNYVNMLTVHTCMSICTCYNLRV